jgi:hypothetical protein
MKDPEINVFKLLTLTAIMAALMPSGAVSDPPCNDPTADCSPIVSQYVTDLGCESGPAGSGICCRKKDYRYRCSGDDENWWRWIIHRVAENDKYCDTFSGGSTGCVDIASGGN